MANRPVYNGSARLVVDRGALPRVRYVMRASTAPVIPGPDESINNATFQAEAGTSIDLNYEIAAPGGTVDVPTDARIRLFVDNDQDEQRTGFVVESANLIVGSLPQSGTVTFTLTQAGTFRIQCEMQKGNGDFSSTSSDWRANSDTLAVQRGALSVITVVPQADKGRLRMGARVNTVVVSERGAAAPSPFAYTGTEAVRVESTFSVSANKFTANETLSHRHRRTGTSIIDVDLASTLISGTVHRTEKTVDDSWPSAATTYDTVVVVTATAALHENNTAQYNSLPIAQERSGNWIHFVGAGTGLTRVDFATVERIASHTVDARAFASHHFQVDDNVFVRSKHDPSKAMLSTQTGFLATRFVNARGAGLNGLTVTQPLTPLNPGTAVSGSSTTATRDGEAGWTDLLAWASSKPGGTWNKLVDITAPADIDANTHTVGAADAYIMFSPDPRIALRGYMNKRTGESDHFTAGQPVVITLTVVDFTTNIRIAPSRISEPTCTLIRYMSTNDTLEYLAADGVTWVAWSGAVAAVSHGMSPSPNDPRTYIRDFADTTSWTRDVVAIMFSAKVDGTPYTDVASREEAGHQGGGSDMAHADIE